MTFKVLIKLKFLNSFKQFFSLFSLYKFSYYLIESFLQLISVILFFIELNVLNLLKYLLKLCYFIFFLLWFRLLSIIYNFITFKRKYYIIMYRYLKFLILTNETLFIYTWSFYIRLIFLIFIFCFVFTGGL